MKEKKETTNSENDYESILKRLDDQEAQLVEQEHRFFRVLYNYLYKRRNWPKGHKKRRAALKALLYSLFFSPTTVAATGGIIAIISVYILYDQTKEIKTQNELLLQQIQQEDDQFTNQRITDLTEILYDTTVTSSTSKLKMEALHEYIVLKRKKDPYARIELQDAQLQGINVKLDTFRNIDFMGTDFFNTLFIEAYFSNCNFALAEGGSLMWDNCVFKNCTFEKFAFNGKDSSNFACTIDGCSFENCDLTLSDASYTWFERCDFSGSSIKGMSIKDSWFVFATGIGPQEITTTQGIPFEFATNDTTFLTELKELSQNKLKIDAEYSPMGKLISSKEITLDNFDSIFFYKEKLY